MGKVLKDYGQFDYVFVMSDNADPRGNLYPNLRKLKSQLKYLKNFLDPNDLVVFSFSGHGVTDSRGNGYLVMADSDPEDLFNTSLK